MGNLANRVPGALKALSKAQFEANRQQTRSNLAGSGIVEYGKHDTRNYVMGEGMFAFRNWPLHLTLGRSPYQDETGGTSDSNYPILNVDGINVHVRGGADTSTHVEYERIKFDVNVVRLPDAPVAQIETSTTTTRTYKRGDHVVVGNDIYVCVHHDGAGVGTSLLNDLYFETRELVTDETLVGIEVFCVELGESVDAVYPYGNVQCQETDWNGFTLDSTVMPDRYSELGEWDTEPYTWNDNTRIYGYGRRWSTMSAAERNIWLSEQGNNIYEEDGKFFQWQYRWKVTRGNGEAWAAPRPNILTNSAIRTSTGRTASANGMLRVRGKRDNEFKDVGPDNGAILLTHGHADRPVEVDPGVGATREGISAVTDYISDSGIAYYLPIATVTRYNQGAYHPVYNPMGTTTFRRLDIDGNNAWHFSQVYKPQSVADCFRFTEEAQSEGAFPYAGYYASGRSGHPMGYMHDVIYTHLVNDLRNSAHGINLSAEDAAYNLTFGLTPGWEPIKKTYFHRSTLSAVSSTQVTLASMPDARHSGAYLFNVTKNLVTGCIRFSADAENLDILSNDVNPRAMPPGTITGSARGALEGNWEVGDAVIYITYEYANVFMREHVATDVIGSPDNILNWLQTHGTNVVYGMDWMSEIPDGTVKSFKATRRAIEVADQSLTSNDVGDNWIADTSFIDNFLLPTNANVREMYLNQIQLIQYVYRSGVMGLNARLPYINGTFSSVWASTSSDDHKGGLMATTLLGDVPEGNGASALRYAIERHGLKNLGGVFYHDSTQLQRIAHAEIDNLDASHGIKYLISLGYNDDTGMVYSQVHYKKLFHQADTIPVNDIDLSTNPTVNIELGKRYRLLNTRNSDIEGVVLSAMRDFTGTWSNATFDDHRLNYDDGRIYRENGSFMTIFELAPIGQFGDDGEFYSPVEVTGIAAYDDLNGRRCISGSMLSRNPLGFLPKDGRR